MAVPYTFGAATAAIPLSQLDSNFASTITLGNTAIQLGNTVTILNNMTFANVTVSSGTVSVTTATATTANLVTINATTLNAATHRSDASLVLQTNGTTTAVTIDGSQNVGVGVTPSAWGSGTKAIEAQGGSFYSVNTSNIAMSQNSYLGASNFIYKNTAAASYYGQSGGAHIWYNAPSGTAGNAISFTQAMTLDASGNLLVGTTSGVASGGFNIQPNGFGTGQSVLDIGHINGTPSAVSFQRYIYNNNVIGSITQSGTTAVLYNTTSDQRLKENIEDAASASDLIDSLQVRQFDWKTDNSHQRYGFVAQELVTVAPEAVHQPADPDEMMAVDYSKLVPMLVKEIQSLRKRLAALENK